MHTFIHPEPKIQSERQGGEEWKWSVFYHCTHFENIPNSYWFFKDKYIEIQSINVSPFLSPLELMINIAGHMAMNFVYSSRCSVNVFVGLPFQVKEGKTGKSWWQKVFYPVFKNELHCHHLALGDKHCVFPTQCVLIRPVCQILPYMSFPQWIVSQHHVEGTGHCATEKWLTTTAADHDSDRYLNQV